MSGGELVLYTRPGCLLCQEVKQRLTDAELSFSVRDVTSLDEARELATKHGATGFPILLRDGVYVGGFTHVVHLIAQGRLKAGPARAPAEARPLGWAARLAAVVAAEGDKGKGG